MGAEYNSWEELEAGIFERYSRKSLLEQFPECEEDEVILLISEHTKDVLDLIKQAKKKKVPLANDDSMPTLWWEGSDGWNMMPNGSGLVEYLEELGAWVRKKLYHATA